MKKVLFLFLFVFLSSCYGIPKIEKVQIKYALDFREYTKDGFLVTPHEYNGEYESVGMLAVEVHPRAKRTMQSSLKNVKIPDGHYMVGAWLVEAIKYQEVVDAIYEEAKAMGADALVDYKLTTVSRTFGENLTIDGIKITGFAIRRK